MAAANLLTAPLLEDHLTESLLEDVQRRREWPTRMTQLLQVNAHKGLEYVFRHPGALTAPWQMKTVLRIPGVQRLNGRLIGIGVRPEHVRATEPAGGLLRGLAMTAGRAAALAVNITVGMLRRKPACIEGP